MSNEDFDPAIFGGLQADEEIDPATAMAAAMPDDDPRPASRLPVAIGLLVAVVVAVAWWLLG